MADLSRLLEAQARVASDVTKLRGVIPAVIVLLTNQKQQLVELAAQIAALQTADNQPAVDDLVAQTNALADQVEATTADVAAATVANTAAAGETPVA